MDRTRQTVFSKRTTKSRKPDPNAPKWLQKSELTFMRTGKLSLNGVVDLDLSLIESRSSMKELNLSKCKITSLEGLAYQPNLSVFVADGSDLSSFKNFESVSNATIFGLKNTPLAKGKHFSLTLQIVAGGDGSKKLIVDGKLLGSSLARRTLQFPVFTGHLVNKGWELEIPCPPSDEMKNLCDVYSVDYVESEEEEDEDMTIEIVGEEEDEADLNHLDLIDRLMAVHNSVIERATRQFELLDESEDRFRTEIKELLEKRRHYVFLEDGDMDLQLVTAVRALCLHRKES